VSAPEDPIKEYPTALDAFRNCPRKYAFDKDPGIRARYRKPTAPAFVGACVHDALEKFFHPYDTPPARRTLETAVQYLREAWSGRSLKGRRAVQRREERAALFGTDRDAEAAAGEKAKHMLWNLVHTQDLAVIPHTTELFHDADLGGGRTLAGKFDRIDRMPDGTLRVVDYKTGKSKPVDRARADDLQLAAYALIAQRKFKVPVSRCSFLFLQEGTEVGWEPDAPWLEAKEAEILGLMDGIRRERALPDGPGKFPPTPNPLCGWCDYRALCPEGQARVAADEGGTDAAEDPPF
jgi:putative RecB family exonuclease